MALAFGSRSGSRKSVSADPWRGGERPYRRPSIRGLSPVGGGVVHGAPRKSNSVNFSRSKIFGSLLFPVSLFHHTPRKTPSCKNPPINHLVICNLNRNFWHLKKCVNGSVHTSVNGFVNTLVNTFVHTSVHYTVNKFVNGSAYLLPFNGLPVVFSHCEQICSLYSVNSVHCGVHCIADR